MASRPLLHEEAPSSFTVASDRESLRTEERIQFVDVTDLVVERVRRSGIAHGLVCIQTRHTTAAIVVNENEPRLLEDVRRLLERLAPGDLRYAHDDLALRHDPAPDESQNGDAHCRALLLPTSATLAVVGGELELGTWQRIFLVELDGPRQRTVTVLVLGTMLDASHASR